MKRKTAKFHIDVRDCYPGLGLRLRVNYAPENAKTINDCEILTIDDWIPQEQVLEAIQALQNGLAELEKA